MEATQPAAKEAVRRLVAEAINENKLAVLDEICSRRFAAELRWLVLAVPSRLPRLAAGDH